MKEIEVHFTYTADDKDMFKMNPSTLGLGKGLLTSVALPEFYASKLQTKLM